MSSEESREFTKWRQDEEARAAHEADRSPYKRRFIKLPPNRINEIDPRDRD